MRFSASGQALAVATRSTSCVLLALAIVPYFVDLGGSAIWDANEAFYVETPRQMIERGDYITPTFNDEPRFNKPVLSYWIVAGVLSSCSACRSASQRLPIALGALVIIACAARCSAGSPRDQLGPRRTWRRAAGRRSAWPSRRGC